MTNKQIEGGSEADLQELCEQLLDFKNIKFFHWPDSLNNFLWSTQTHAALQKNAMHYNWLQGCKKQISKYALGLPDLAIWKPQRIYNSTLFVELKVKKRQPSQGQRNFAKMLNVVRVDDFNDFQELITEWEKA